jgi:hypothetical protein
VNQEVDVEIEYKEIVKIANNAAKCADGEFKGVAFEAVLCHLLHIKEHECCENEREFE